MSTRNLTILSKITPIVVHFLDNESTSTTKQDVFQPSKSNWTNQYVQDSDFNILLWSTIDCFLCVAILTGNTLTVVSIVFSRRLANVVSNLFILSLATSDLLVGLVTPYHMAFYIDPQLGRNFALCMIRLGLMSLACIASLCNIISIAIDRYIAIVYPLRYNKLITKKTARIISLVSWLVAIAIATAPVYWNEFNTNSHTRCELGYVLSPYYVLGIQVPAFVFIFVAMCVVYFKIVREANKHAKRIRKNNKYKTVLPDCWKSVQVLMLVMGCFTISYTPYLLTMVTNTVFGIRTGYTSTVYKITNSLAMANSAINPLIYAWKNKEIKTVFSRILHCQSINGNSADTSIKDSARSSTGATATTTTTTTTNQLNGFQLSVVSKQTSSSSVISLQLY